MVEKLKQKNMSGEKGYLDLLKDILENGEKRGDRTNVGTISKFGAQLRFDLSQGFPLLTTKKVFFRGIKEELLWFLNGSTDAKLLSDKGIHIWDSNGTREFLDAKGLTEHPEGYLGPVYGHQWRNWGGDQLLKAIELIKTNPQSRRIIVSAWNVDDIPNMALPPCHILFQFYVSMKHNTLSCHLYQRSADMALGVPFNIASYALLTHMVARATNLGVGDLVMSLGDAHIYQNHVEGVKEQLERTPKDFPKLVLRPNIGVMPWEYTSDDIQIENYKYDPKIKFKMAV